MKLSLSILFLVFLESVSVANALKGARRMEESGRPGRALKKSKSHGGSSEDDDNDGENDDERTDTGGPGQCTNDVSPLPAVDLCKSTSECVEMGYVSCRQLPNYKVCSDGTNYLDNERVCDENETPGGDTNDVLLFPPTASPSPTASPLPGIRTDGGTDDNIILDETTTAPATSPATPSNSGCVVAGPSNYVKSTVPNYNPDQIYSPDECISNLVGPCPGKCKAYQWNVCDDDGQFPKGVKPLCT